MSTFVLVHGAWHGGWCYKPVAQLLRKAGHQVYTPTLTGLGERSHLMSPAVNVDTHVQDIVNVFRWEELSDVVLAGHSYGGMVITGVADKIPTRFDRWSISMRSCRPTDKRSSISCRPICTPVCVTMRNKTATAT